ncbi:MAG: bifunctional DNA primase/polymerase [Chloroflexota bacterium]|nr:bifunctional DNA primase/polymerase [Chloroflexota bacterium]
MSISPQRPPQALVPLYNARLGLNLFPAHNPTHSGGCSCRDPHCESIGKHPRWAGWQTEATRDQLQIQRWKKALPYTNWLHAIGDDELILDVDPRNGGDESLAQFEREHGALPDTWRVITGSHGEHHYFRIQPGVQVKSGPLTGYPGLDIKAARSLVIAPGSLHASGRRYEWDGGAHPEDMPRALAPDALITLANRPVPAAPAEHDAPITTNRNNTLTSIAGRLRRDGLSPAAIEAALVVTNEERCQPPLSESEVRAIARGMARYPAGTLPPAPDPAEEVQRLKAQLVDARAREHEKDKTYKGLLAAIRNEKLTPGERIAYVVLMLELEHGDDTPEKHHPDERLDGYVKVNVGVLAGSGGMSADAVSPKLKALEERHGLVQRKREFERDPEQQDRFGRAKIIGSHLYVKPTGPLATATLAQRLATIGTLDPEPVVKDDGTVKSWGGSRCKACGGPRERKTVEFCPKCETVEVRPITPPEEPEGLNPQDADLDDQSPPLDMVGIYNRQDADLDTAETPQTAIQCRVGPFGYQCPYPDKCRQAGRCNP